MVFGSVVSASTWKPFQQAIDCLAAAYFTNKSLVINHTYWLDMLRWVDEPEPDVTFMPARGSEVVPRIKESWMNLVHLSQGHISSTLTMIYWQIRGLACTTLWQQIWKQSLICWDGQLFFCVSVQFCLKIGKP